MVSIEQLRRQDFGTHSELIHAHAQLHPERTALIADERRVTYAELDAWLDRIAASLQRDGVRAEDAVAVCAATSLEYAALFFGILRAGAAVTPLSPGSSADALHRMVEDSGATLLFADAPALESLRPSNTSRRVTWVSLDDSSLGRPWNEWLTPHATTPEPVSILPQAPFNIIYSSGTTGTPKGIVQPHSMRWAQLVRAPEYDYEEDGRVVTLVSTPLYSNTTLVSFLPTLAGGGTVVLLPKFDAHRFLAVAQRHRVTHAMLVPVQYARIMSVPDFGSYDLSSFVMKFCTSAPFSAALKADVLARWPGGLTEYYGMTEGGASCCLLAHERPDKLHTVGQPLPGHDMRLIDEHSTPVPVGELGEVVGRSPAMMIGYHNKPGKTSEVEWFDGEGQRFIRTGDIGRFDSEGFLTIVDRKKDMIITGGFNVYPSDLEAIAVQHEAVQEAAVVGVPSEQWGETPIVFVVRKPGRSDAPEAIRSWLNERLGKTQRVAALSIVPELPRSAIGKVLKQKLCEDYAKIAMH